MAVILSAPGAPLTPLPVVDVQIALADIPLAAAPVWTSVGARVVSLTTTRGRAYEQDQAQIGTATVVVDAHDGVMTPGNGASTLDTDRPIRVLVTPPAPYNGTTYQVHSGILDSLPLDKVTGWDGDTTSTIGSQDALQTISQNALLSAYDQEVIATGPTAYYPLSEAEGAAAFASISGSAATLTPEFHPTFQSVAPGQYAGGAAALTVADDATCVEFAPEISTGAGAGNTISGWGLITSDPTGIAQVGTTGFAVSCIFAAGPSAGEILTQSPASSGGFNYFSIGNGLGQTSVKLPITSGTSGPFLFFSLDNGSFWTDLAEHHLALSVNLTGRTATLWVDGVGQTVTLPTGYTYQFPANCQLRVGDGWWPFGGQWFSGRLGKVALWNRPLLASEVAAQFSATTGFAGELTGARANRILGYAGWPTGQRIIDTGESTAGILKSAGQTANQLLQTLAATEMGAWFVNAAGYACWYGRARTRNTVSRQTLTSGQDGSAEPDLQFGYDRRHIINTVSASRNGGAQVNVVNAAAVARRRTYSQTYTFDLASDYDVLQASTWLTVIYANPRTRVSQVSVDPLTNPTLWPFALTVEILDRITLTNLPAYAPATSMDFIVQQVAHSASQSPAKWLTTLTLTPIELYSTLRADGAPSTFTKLDSGLKIPY